MAKDKKEATFEPPSSQVSLAQRLEDDHVSRRMVSTAPTARPQDEDDGLARDYGENSGDDAYLGTDVMYQNHANDTEAPGKAEGDENPEQVLEEYAYEAKEEGQLAGEPKAKADEDTGEPQAKADEDTGDKANQESTPSSQSAASSRPTSGPKK